MNQFLKSHASRSNIGCARSIGIVMALTVTLGVASSAYAIFYHFGLDIQANCTSAGFEALKINSVFNLDPSTNVVDYVIKIPEFTGTIQSVVVYDINDPFVDLVSCSVTGATPIEDLGNSLIGSFTLTGAEATALQNGDYVIIACDGPADCFWGIIGKGRERIPTVSQWGLVAMTGLVLVAGTIVVHRRRRLISA